MGESYFQHCNRFVGTAVKGTTSLSFFFLFSFFFNFLLRPVFIYLLTVQHVQSRLHHVLEPRAKETHVQVATSRAAGEQLENPHITFHISLSGRKSMNIEVI
jgi:hypothetical protein